MPMHNQIHRHTLHVTTLNCILLKKHMLKTVMGEVTATKHSYIGMWLNVLNFSSI